MTSLTTLNTFGLVAEAEHFFTLSSESQLGELLQQAQLYQDYFILGGGSNVILNTYIRRFVIHNQLKGIHILRSSDEGVWVEVSAGEVWHDFVCYCLANKWYGLENLALIPGTVGAAPVQNIGAYGKEVKDYIDSVYALNLHTGEYRCFSREECLFAYRDSIFKHDAAHYLILRVVFYFPKVWRALVSYADLNSYPGITVQSSAQEVFDAVVKIRQHKLPDPKQIGNAGSFFKNPIVPAEQYMLLKAKFPALVAYPQVSGEYKLAAGWMIDQCGWKGKSLGRVAVHERQALVLVNGGGATMKDVKCIAQAIQKDVKQCYGVDIEPEPIFVE